MENFKFSEKKSESPDIFDEVRRLNLPAGEYALFGSAPLAIRGMRPSHDADLIVADDLWGDLVERGWQGGKNDRGSEFLAKDDIEVWKDWLPWFTKEEVNEFIKEAEIIEGLPFVKLEHVIEWKKAYGREKDLKDVQMILEYLAQETIPKP